KLSAIHFYDTALLGLMSEFITPKISAVFSDKNPFVAPAIRTVLMNIVDRLISVAGSTAIEVAQDAGYNFDWGSAKPPRSPGRDDQGPEAIDPLTGESCAELVSMKPMESIP